jgi:F420-dependent oxidoreductase-like protein
MLGMAQDSSPALKIGLRLEVYRAAQLKLPVALVQRAEALGYHSVWSAEAYGADALTPLAYLAAVTSHIKLGTAVAQVAARPPTALAMAAMSIDAMAGGGRVILGLGVSGPQVVEGWYGQPWGSPNERLRDYFMILRQALDRKQPVSYEGREISMPYRGPGSLGQGKPLRSILHPPSRIPVWIAAGGARNVSLAAELADGWLPMGLGPGGVNEYTKALGDGRARRAAEFGDDGHAAEEDFEVFGGLTVTLTDDVRGVLDASKPLTAMYVGGMGSESHNYHRDAMARRGFPEAADLIGELWRAGRKDEAIAAVPDDYLEQTTFAGSPERIARLWESGVVGPGVTGVIVSIDQPETLELVAKLGGLTSRTETVGASA